MERQRSEGGKEWKGRDKTLLFVDNLIIYTRKTESIN
jgi:hypothetical protein